MTAGIVLVEELLPEQIRGLLRLLSLRERERAEELRLRTGRSPRLLLPEGERSLGGGNVTGGDLGYVLDRASRSSLHSVQHELCRGYLTARGGLRIGICGVFSGAKGESMRDISSLAIRIPHEMRGAGKEAIERLRSYDRSVLIISTPGGGKTTFLRELIRTASESGRRVSVCDERGEIAAMWRGQPCFDLGTSTDVLSGCPKGQGIVMLLRAMNPEIIAVDEISASTDTAALEQAACCGSAVFATAHASSVDELRRRPDYRRLLDMGIFERAVVISGRERRQYEVVELC